ncbi:MAG: ATP-binding protein [Candidatus Omnitrophica bacterium]|nr:ATP-binding protein [Candidatus Omnitrophota bacterium]
MKVQAKLISLFLLLSAIFIVGRHFYQVFEDKRMYSLFKEDNGEKNIYFDKLMKLKGASLETLAFDYTYWDEMVSFVKHNDIAWAEKTIDETVLKTYQADAIWIYKMDLSLLYSIKSQGAIGLKDFPLPEGSINNIFSKDRFCHFFINTNAGLMEVRGATIHPSADPERKTSPHGYLFAGRLWNKEYTSELADLVGGEIKISLTKQEIPSLRVLLGASSIVLSRELAGWQEKPVAYIYATIQSKEVEIYKLFSRNTIVAFFGFLIAVLIFITAFIATSVNLPLGMISQALKRENPAELYRLEKESSEFGDISRLITKFFRQKNELIKEIIERKKVQRAVQEYTRQIEKANKELDDFTYIVSHDLKEPLRSIDAFSKFIQDDYKDKLGAEASNYIERIRANAGRMQDLIEDLLEISHIERRENLFEEVQASEVLTEVTTRLEYAIKQKGVEVIVRDKLPNIFCDRVRLGEVFLNLISNAIKFCDKPKPLIEVGCSETADFYEFWVKDNGPGIEEKYFDKIFEIFQRLDRREDHEGTGAGLTIAKKIVEMHKGKIRVESKIGEGATFYFTIPKGRQDGGKNKIHQDITG